MDTIPKIAVIGAASATTDVLEIAYAVGAAVVESRCHLICGGKSGVMEAACRGFRFSRNELSSVRLIAIGFLPEETTDFANEFVDIAIPTGLGIARNALIARAADGVVAVGGGSGTLSELALAWQMGKPIAALGDSGGWSARLAGEVIDDSKRDPVYAAVDAVDAVDYLRKYLGAVSRGEPQ